MKPAEAGVFALLITASLCSGCGLGNATAAPTEVSQAIDSLLQNAAQGTWSATYETMTAPGFREKVSKEEYEKIGRLIHDRLGKLVSKSSTSFLIRNVNGVVTVQATYDAQFDLGKGTLRTTVLKTADGWRFLGFWIVSPELMETPGVPCAECGNPRPKDAAFCPACGKKVDPASAPPPGK